MKTYLILLLLAITTCSSCKDSSKYQYDIIGKWEYYLNQTIDTSTDNYIEHNVTHQHACNFKKGCLIFLEGGVLKVATFDAYCVESESTGFWKLLGDYLTIHYNTTKISGTITTLNDEKMICRESHSSADIQYYIEFRAAKD